MIEESLRLVESLARSAAVLRAPVGHAEREQRPPTLERDGQAAMNLKRLPEQFLGGLLVAAARG